MLKVEGVLYFCVPCYRCLWGATNLHPGVTDALMDFLSVKQCGLLQLIFFHGRIHVFVFCLLVEGAG